MRTIDVKFDTALRLDLLTTDENKAWKLRPGKFLLARSLRRAPEPLVTVLGDVKVGVREYDDAEHVSKAVHVFSFRKLARDLRQIVNGRKGVLVNELEGLDVASPGSNLPRLARAPQHDEGSFVIDALQLREMKGELDCASGELAAAPGCLAANSRRS